MGLKQRNETQRSSSYTIVPMCLHWIRNPLFTKMRKPHCQHEAGGFGLQKESQACGSGWSRVMMCFLLDKALHVGRTNEVAEKTFREARSREHGRDSTSCAQ